MRRPVGAGRVFRYAVATGRAETDPTSVLRGALITPKPKHHSALLEPDAVGELLRAIDSYSGNVMTRVAMQVAPSAMQRSLIVARLRSFSPVPVASCTIHVRAEG